MKQWKYADRQHELWKVQGSGVAIVKGDEAIISRGFGLRDVVKGASAQTLEFVLGDDGAVKEIVAQPAGVFTPVAEDAPADAPQP